MATGALGSDGVEGWLIGVGSWSRIDLDSLLSFARIARTTEVIKKLAASTAVVRVKKSAVARPVMNPAPPPPPPPIPSAPPSDLWISMNPTRARAIKR